MDQGIAVFRRAETRDAPAIAALINSANSGDGGTAGWTHEAELFEGERTHPGEVLEMLSIPGSTFVLRMDGEGIAGCAYLRPMGDAGYMGVLAVRPRRQSGGIGKEVIAECERVVRDEWGFAALRISVITTHRPELTAFYERRGFERTGRFKPFERRQAIDGAKVPGIRLEWMEKRLAP